MTITSTIPQRVTVRIAPKTFPDFETVQEVKNAGPIAVQALWKTARKRTQRGMLANWIATANLHIESMSFAQHGQAGRGVVRMDLNVDGVFALCFQQISTDYAMDASNTAKLILQASILYEKDSGASCVPRASPATRKAPTPKTFDVSSLDEVDAGEGVLRRASEVTEAIRQDVISTVNLTPAQGIPLVPGQAKSIRFNPENGQWEILRPSSRDARMSQSELKDISMFGGVYRPMSEAELQSHGKKAANSASETATIELTKTTSVPSPVTLALVLDGPVTKKAAPSIEDMLFAASESFLDARLAA
jgi:hypothetical protein